MSESEQPSRRPVQLAALRALVRSLRLQQSLEAETATRVVLLWHEEVFGAYKYFADSGALAMISPSRDGRLAGMLAQAMNIDVVAASSNKQPLAGMRALLRLAPKYRFVLFAADGPRGPRQQLNPGGIWLARRLQVPIMTVRFGLNGVRLGSWDKMIIPYPFSAVKLQTAEPELVRPDADLDASLGRYQQRMQQLQCQ